MTQLGVQQGDTVTVSAYGFYPQAQQRSFWFSLASFLAGLVGQQPNAPVGGDPGRGRKNLPLLQVGVAAGLPALKQATGGVPLGYLRVLVFNKDSTLVSAQTQQVQLTKLANGGYESLSTKVILAQDGYVTAYVGNESDVDVFFDDVSVEHRQGLQVQENQYDPYGLDLAGISSAVPGLRLKNFYQFNGKENQLDLGLSWNHHDWRFFDYQLGRWHAVDPMIEEGQEHWTPYQFGFDNAVRFNDPDGQNPFLVAAAAGAAIGAVVGAGIEAGTQMYNNGGHVSDWHAVGGAALQGGVTGGLAGLTGGTSLLRSGAAGAVSNVAGGIAKNVYDGKPITVGSVAKDAAIGAATGIAGHAAGKAVGAVASRLRGGAAVAAEAEVGAGAHAAETPSVSSNSGPHHLGTEKPWTEGATPHSTYTHVKNGKAVQNAIYDSDGKVVGHVDFKNHGPGAPSGHGHEFPIPGNPASGHGPGKPHIPANQLPSDWLKLPTGIQPHTPLGQ